MQDYSCQIYGNLFNICIYTKVYNKIFKEKNILMKRNKYQQKFGRDIQDHKIKKIFKLAIFKNK